MTGAPPYNAQSPTQQHRYPAYESPSKNRPFYPNNEQPQQSGQQQYPPHPPQTPPAFPPSSISRSPRFSHASSPMPGSLPPPLNGAAPPAHPSHLESSTQYQGHSTSGTPSLPPPRSLAHLPGNSASPYGPSTPHGHPSGRPEGHSQSPSRESESPYRVRGNGAGFGGSMAQEPRRSSPPRETVCLKLRHLCLLANFLTFVSNLEACPSGRSYVLCEHPVRALRRSIRTKAITAAIHPGCICANAAIRLSSS